MYLPHSLTHSFIHSSHWQNDKIKTFRTFTTSTSIQTSALELKHHHCLWIYEWVGLFFICARHTIRCWFKFNAFRAFHIWNASHFSIWAMCRVSYVLDYLYRFLLRAEELQKLPKYYDFNSFASSAVEYFQWRKYFFKWKVKILHHHHCFDYGVGYLRCNCH